MYESMVSRMKQRAVWLSLDAIPLNQDVNIQYRKRAELCINSIDKFDKEKTKRAMVAWMFWMRQIHGTEEIENRKVIMKIN